MIKFKKKVLSIFEEISKKYPSFRFRTLVFPPLRAANLPATFELLKSFILNVSRVRVPIKRQPLTRGKKTAQIDNK